MTHIIIPGRAVRGRCRVCKQPFFDTDADAVIGRHMAECGQQHYEATFADRRKLDFLKAQDPELETWMRDEFRKGRLKPSTDPV